MTVDCWDHVRYEQKTKWYTIKGPRRKALMFPIRNKSGANDKNPQRFGDMENRLW